MWGNDYGIYRPTYMFGTISIYNRYSYLDIDTNEKHWNLDSGYV